jgi:hypothetical protein
MIRVGRGAAGQPHHDQTSRSPLVSQFTDGYRGFGQVCSRRRSVPYHVLFPAHQLIGRFGGRFSGDSFSVRLAVGLVSREGRIDKATLLVHHHAVRVQQAASARS